MTRALLSLCLWLGAAPARAGDAPQPRIYPRSTWTRQKVGKIPDDPVKTRIVLHHTAHFVTEAEKRLTGRASWNAAVAHARGALKFHTHIRGWKDVGYHYMIDWEGRILEGRPVELLGAHVEKHNTGSIGIVLMGDLSRQRPTAKQVASLKALLAWLMDEYHIPPSRIGGHYQMKYTICPGTYLNNLWDPDAKPLDWVQVAPRPKR